MLFEAGGEGGELIQNYSDNRLQNHMDQFLESDVHDEFEFQAKVKADHDRKEFILNRIKETGPMGYGKRSEMPDPSLQKVLHGIAVGPELMPPRSSSMKTLLYHEVAGIMEGVIERSTHNFVIPNLNNRLKEFNSERPVGQRKGAPVHPSKLLEAKLGGLVDKKPSAGGSGSSSSMKSPSRGGSALSSKQRRQAREAENDDLGGTGSAFGVDDLTMVDTDGESDNEDSTTMQGNKGASSGIGGFGSSGRMVSPLGSKRGSMGGNAHTKGTSRGGGHQFKNAGMGSASSGWSKGREKQQHRHFKDYKFPDQINVNPMDFLNEDMELILEYADKKAKEKQAAAVEEENKAGQLRSKTRKKKEY